MATNHNYLADPTPRIAKHKILVLGLTKQCRDLASPTDNVTAGKHWHRVPIYQRKQNKLSNESLIL